METTVKKCFAIVVLCAMLFNFASCNPDDGLINLEHTKQSTDGEDGGHKEDPDGD